MYQLQLSIASLCLLLIHQVASFTVIQPLSASNIKSSITTQLNAIEVPSLDILTDDHEKEGARLAKSIAGWLDDEWLPQEIHVQMGESAKNSFIKARTSGKDEVRFVCILSLCPKSLKREGNE